MNPFGNPGLRGLAAAGCALFLASGAICLAGEGASKLPAFPGAGGFGAFSVGGRGGRVIKVTNLNADGPGSFAEACAAKGPRIVVFDVSGVIKVKGKGKHGLQITESNITIAGQTAPGAGITIEDGFGAFFYGKNVTEPRVRDITVRFLRARTTKGRAEHAVEFAGAERFILDHVSGAWGQDEGMGLTTNRNFTIQWCNVEETEIHLEGGLRRAEPHNFGMIMGYTEDGACTLHHLLFANHSSRAPLDNGNTRLEQRNNVFYNIGFGGYPQESKTVTVNLVGNYVKAGPGAIIGARAYRPPFTYAMPQFGPGRKGQSYVAGNYYDLDWVGGYFAPWKGEGGRVVPAERLVDQPFPFPPVETHTAEEAYEQIMAHGGCLPRDSVSKRVVREVATRTGGYGRHVPDAGLMEGLTPGKAPADADNDGMPDEWEKTHGLNPNDPADNNRTVPAGASPGDRHKGYTWIEYYINELADNLVAQALTEARLGKPGGEPDYGPANGLYGPPQPVSELVAAIVAKDRNAKAWYAVEQLSRLGPAAGEAVPALIKALEADDDQGVAFAAWALGAIGPAAKEAVPALARELGKEYQPKSKGWCRHGYAAWALGRMGPEAREAVPALVKALSDKVEVHAQRPAAWALGQIGPEAKVAVEALLGKLANNDSVIAWHAAEALASIGEPAVPGLKSALEANKSALPAIGAVGRIGPKAKDCVPALLKLAGDKNVLVRAAAADALVRVDPAAGGVTAALVKLLGDAEMSVRHSAARALGTAGPAARDAVPAVEKALKDEHKEVRRAAALALGGIGKDAVGTLARALAAGDLDGWTRAQCARALGKGGPGSAEGVKALITALADESAEVRREAVWSLALIGPAAREAVAALEKAAGGDPDYVVPVAAAAALKRISGKE